MTAACAAATGASASVARRARAAGYTASVDPPRFGGGRRPTAAAVPELAPGGLAAVPDAPPAGGAAPVARWRRGPATRRGCAARAGRRRRLARAAWGAAVRRGSRPAWRQPAARGSRRRVPGPTRPRDWRRRRAPEACARWHRRWWDAGRSQPSCRDPARRRCGLRGLDGEGSRRAGRARGRRRPRGGARGRGPAEAAVARPRARGAAAGPARARGAEPARRERARSSPRLLRRLAVAAATALRGRAPPVVRRGLRARADLHRGLVGALDAARRPAPRPPRSRPATRRSSRSRRRCPTRPRRPSTRRRRGPRASRRPIPRPTPRAAGRRDGARRWRCALSHSQQALQDCRWLRTTRARRRRPSPSDSDWRITEHASSRPARSALSAVRASKTALRAAAGVPPTTSATWP